MTELEVYLGLPASFDVQCRNRVTRTPLGIGDLLATDTLSGKVWRGQDQSPLFTFTPIWFTNGATQNGYDQGQITLPISAAQSVLLEANGEFLLTAYTTRGGQTWPIWEGRMRCYPQPGAAT